MRVSELSVGDWAHLHYKNMYDGEVSFNFRVTLFTMHYGHEVLVWGESPDGKHHGNMGEARKIEPVPITAEMLAKNFPTPEKLVWFPYEDSFHCETSVEGIMVSGQFYFVHQLQHALRLAGLFDLADNFIVD